MKEFFIRTNVPSLKNSKRWTGKYLISSQSVMEYLKATKYDYLGLKKDMLKELENKTKPYKISFKFIRGSKHKFDYINAVQLPLDILVDIGVLNDDNANEVVPIFESYEYNKEYPGVIIKIL
jgi:hypothetical protein